jgi:predicted Zn-dependent protease
MDALSRCIDEACAFPPDRFADAGDVMLAAARELRAHGHPTEGMALAKRAIAWYVDQQPPDGKRGTRDRRTLARAYYKGGQWGDAAGVVRDLAAESPDDLDVIALAGAIAARRGDNAAARDALAALQARKGRFRFGLQLVHSARVLAILGEPDQAIPALRGAFARGYCYGIDLHTDMDLTLLGAEPSFRELLRPKG